MKINCKQLFLGFLSLFSMEVADGQSNVNTIKALTKHSKVYLDLLFNQRRPDSAAAYWTKNVYHDLTVGYNNGKIHYKDENDLLVLFSNDFRKFFKSVKLPFKFILLENPVLLDDDEVGFKHFLIKFSIQNNVKIEKSLKHTFIDFITHDDGKTWLINDDQWIKDFMYFKYRK